MLAVEFRFLAGRFHATPWDRHVNEGAVAWPPEPWRILRALVATWHHKIKPTGKHNDSILKELIESLAREPPRYRLPPASHSHARHYMPQYNTGKKALVLDAFAAIERGKPLAVVWPTVQLPQDHTRMLDDLLAAMGYLGRAESWIEAQRVDQAPETNCDPVAETGMTAGQANKELVDLLAPLPPEHYATHRSQYLVDNKAKKKYARTLPESFLDALCVETADLRKQGWSQPPATRKVPYLRPAGAFTPQRMIRKYRAPKASTARFVLIGKPLPRVEDTLRIGELLRIAVMSQARRRYGEADIPPIFSGHGLPQGNRHGHAFYLPWDSDGDGRIDRLVIHVPLGMDAGQQKVLAALTRLWHRDGSQWPMVLEGIGDEENVAPELVGPGTVWRSITPYLHPWHVKKRFTVEDQLRRECRERGLPDPVVLERLQSVDVGRGRARRPVHYHRFRRRRGLPQPDRLGSFWRLTFPEPVTGPLALGFSCHFGLGLFKPEKQPKSQQDER